MKFKELLKNRNVLKSIEELGYENATEIQERIIPLINDGVDVLGQSKTGTGKTLAFAAPILENIVENKCLQALILAPTRELAIQIARETEVLGKYTNIGVCCVYGSSSIEEQIRNLKKGVEIVIGTPGRVMDLIKRGKLKLSEIKYFVLDEADEMLSMGFQEELEFIFEKTNNDRQALLFSATMPKAIVSMAKKYMSMEYQTVSVVSEEKTADNITQNYYLVSDSTRFEAMCRVMDYYQPSRAIIFCRTKRNADEVLQKLSERSYNVDVIHGDITQAQRIATLDRFKLGQFNYLIATDVAARGIHVDDIELVINFNLPESNEAYIHRIGRTGRANKSGMAVTFVKQNELRILSSLEKYIIKPIVEQELPTIEAIKAKYMGSLIEKLDVLKNSKDEPSYFNEYLSLLSKEEIVNITSKLLNKELLSKFGSKTDVSVVVKSKKKDRGNNSSDDVRLFLTIGKIDNIEKRELLLFIENKANVKEGTCTKVEVMTKFTFMSVKKEFCDKIIKSCNNIKYKGRLIRIEKAKN